MRNGEIQANDWDRLGLEALTYLGVPPLGIVFNTHRLYDAVFAICLVALKRHQHQNVESPGVCCKIFLRWYTTVYASALVAYSALVFGTMRDTGGSRN